MELIMGIVSVILFIFILAIEYRRKFNVTRIRGSIIEAGNYLCIFLSLLISYMLMIHVKAFGQTITLTLVKLINIIDDYSYFPIIFAMIMLFVIAVVVYIVLRIIFALLIRVILNPYIRKINKTQETKTEKEKRRLGMFLSIPRALFYMCLLFVVLNVAVKIL